MSEPTDCSKCKAPMTELPRSSGRSPVDIAKMTITGYRCAKCGHWNNLKRRKPRKEAA